jgi:hypothetical protein
MPYALAVGDGRVFAGLANGDLWESEDAGNRWHALDLRGNPPGSIVALAATT